MRRKAANLRRAGCGQAGSGGVLLYLLVVMGGMVWVQTESWQEWYIQLPAGGGVP